MKKYFFPALLLLTLAFSSCGNDAKPEPAPDTVLPKRPDSTEQAAYICPMGAKCGYSDTAGKCASCGMDLVANKH